MRFEYREKSQSIIDTWNGKIYAGGRALCDLLNDLDGKWIDEFSLRETLQQDLQIAEEKNKQLQKDCTSLVYHNQDYRKENEELKETLGAILLEVKRDIAITNYTGEIKVFINPGRFELISEVLKKYGALKEWYNE